jgi:AcrR family transcriptional regulator
MDGFSRRRITAAALSIVDRDGLDGLTMRRLAQELGTGPASLYRHVANRDELLVELMDHVLGDIRPPTPEARTWRCGIEWMAREVRRVLLDHPAVVPLVPGDPLLGPNAMRGREIGLRLLRDHGFAVEDAIRIYAIVIGWTVGQTLLVVTGPGTRGEALRSWVADVPDRDGDLPTVRELASAGGLPEAEVIFELGLATLLDGVEARFRR